MSCDFFKEFYDSTIEFINSLDLLKDDQSGKAIIEKRYFKKFKEFDMFNNVYFSLKLSEALRKCKTSQEKPIIFQKFAKDVLDYIKNRSDKMKNCCNCCNCCCEKQFCNKKDYESIKIEVEKEIGHFVADTRDRDCFGRFENDGKAFVLLIRYYKGKIKNIPTIEIWKFRVNEEGGFLIDYFEDMFTSNHRVFSIEEKIQTAKRLNSYIGIRQESWLSEYEEAIK